MRGQCSAGQWTGQWGTGKWRTKSLTDGAGQKKVFANVNVIGWWWFYITAKPPLSDLSTKRWRSVRRALAGYVTDLKQLTRVVGQWIAAPSIEQGRPSVRETPPARTAFWKVTRRFAAYTMIVGHSNTQEFTRECNILALSQQQRPCVTAALEPDDDITGTAGSVVGNCINWLSSYFCEVCLTTLCWSQVFRRFFWFSHASNDSVQSCG